MMDCIELKVKDGLSISDLVPELLKVSKDELINSMLHLVFRVCGCDKKIAKIKNSCDGLLIENEKLKRDVSLGDKLLVTARKFTLEKSLEFKNYFQNLLRN